MSEQDQSKQPEQKELKNPFPLKYPIETKDGRRLTELKFEPLSIGDLESVEGETNSKTKSIKMLAMSAMISEDDVRKIKVIDFEGATDVVIDLMGF